MREQRLGHVTGVFDVAMERELLEEVGEDPSGGSGQCRLVSFPIRRVTIDSRNQGLPCKLRFPPPHTELMSTDTLVALRASRRGTEIQPTADCRAGN
jgi:hypothetical protein